MTERERILDLIKKGVLSTEEGLDLLENLGKTADKKSTSKEFVSSEEGSKKTNNHMNYEGFENFDGKDQLEEGREAVSEDEAVEEEYEELANQINKYSAELDQVNDQLSKLKADRIKKRDRLDELTVGFEDEKSDRLKDLRTDLDDLTEELRLVKAMDEIDNRAEIKQLQREIDETAQAIEEVETKEDNENEEEINQLREDLSELDEEIDGLHQEKTVLMKELHASKMQQWSNKAKNISSKFEIPDNWKDEADQMFTKAGEAFDTTSRDFSDMIKKSFSSAKTAFDSVEWKNKSFKVPTIGKTKLEKDWTFDEQNPTILEFKNANGNVHIEETDAVDSIQINAKITLYGKMDEASPEEAFDVRTNIEADEDKLTFSIPNKRIKADLKVQLPKQTYDYMSVNVLNGNVVLDHIDVKDVYVKSSNGNFQINDTIATMVEIKGTNGNVLFNDVEMKDLIINTINGDVRVQGNVNSSNIVTTAGAIRATLSGDELTHIEANSVNGDVKIAVPSQLGIEVDAKTLFGKVKSRLSDVQDDEMDTENNKANKRILTRLTEGTPMRVNVRTTTGNILFKDTDQ